MSTSVFHEETIKVIRHLQRRLITLIDSAHSPEVLKNDVVDYLENLIQAGPHYIDVEEYRQPAKHKDPPGRVGNIGYPFTGRNPRNLTQQMVPNAELNRFLIPSDRETIFHGIRIPPGCDIVELPSIRPHVRDFFFVEGNVKHFVSVDERPTSENSPSDRVIFHNTCPQRNKSGHPSTVPKAYQLHRPYIALCPVDAEDYDNDHSLLENYLTPNNTVRKTTAPSCRALSNENRIKRIVDIPEIRNCNQGQSMRHSSNIRSTPSQQPHFQLQADSHMVHKHRHAKNSFPEPESPNSHSPCNHWSCNLQKAIGSRNQIVNKKHSQRTTKAEFHEEPLEHAPDCPMNKDNYRLPELTNVCVKTESSVSNYEKRLPKKYDTNVADNAEIERTCNHHQCDSNHQHHAEVAQFEKHLNEKYSMKHTCGKENEPLASCDHVAQVKRESSTNTSMNELDERIRGLTEGIKRKSNEIEEDTISEDIGDETFMERMLRVKPLKSIASPVKQEQESPQN